MSSTLAAAISGTALGHAVSKPHELLLDPSAKFVKDHRRTAVASVSIDGREVFVKRFKPYAWYRRFEWCVTGGPARRCWRVSSELAEAGFAVAPPLACIETRAWALPDEGYFVTAAVDGAVPSGRFWREQGPAAPLARRRFWLRALARELRAFHDRGFYTRDANADNVLVQAEGDGPPRFYWLDLENVRRFGSVSRRRRAKNLVQLERPVRSQVSQRDRLCFLREYFGTPLRAVRSTLGELTARAEQKEAEYRARRRAK